MLESAFGSRQFGVLPRIRHVVSQGAWLRTNRLTALSRTNLPGQDARRREPCPRPSRTGGTVFGYKTMKKISTSAAFVVALVAISPCMASIQFAGAGSGSSSNNLAASATFDVVGGSFQVTLANSSIYAIAAPQDVLMGLYFSVIGITDLTPAASNAATASGFIVYSDNGNILQNPGSPGAGYLDVSGEWAYVESTSGSTGTFRLGTAGRGVWGASDVMNGADRNNSQAPDGADFGIVSSVTDLTSGNNGYKNNGPYVQDSVLFDLGPVPVGFQLTTDAIASVTFVYGTSSSDPSFPGNPVVGPPPPVPEPASFAVWSMLIAAMAFVASRKK